MSALGDSITRAYNVDSSNWIEHPEHSWSTGYDANDIVNSHYEHIKKKNRNIAGNNFNDAESGANMADLPFQADLAIAHNAQYITIEMGGNDLCTSSPSTMTTVDAYRASFRAAADKIKASLPNAKVYVASVPDVYQLWALYDGDWQAEATWYSFSICQSLLSNSRSEADRQLVRQRNIDFNTVLSQEAASYGFHWDNNAVFNVRFERRDVSQVDYFHPSMYGQAKLADTTWAAGPYSSIA